MITLIIGNVGSGKTITAVREIVMKKIFAYTNIELQNLKHWHRLKYKDILLYDDNLRAAGVNWKFWEDVVKKRKDFSIVIDELHNIIHSRTFYKKENLYMGQFFSQSRKILYDKPNNHMIIISQDAHKIDIDVRELASLIIKCESVKIKDKVVIINTFYEGLKNYENEIAENKKIWFFAEKYYHYFNTIQFLKFNPEGWL